MDNKKITIISILLAVCVLTSTGFLSCLSADARIAKQKIGCNQIDRFNAAVCCLKFMSSGTGSDSKDAVCRPLVDELTKLFKSERKKNLLEFCLNSEKKNNGYKRQKCLDLID